MDTSKILRRMVRLAIKDSTLSVAEYAGDHHRFISRTGNLERAIQTKVTDDRGIVYLDENIANYAQAIHQGARPRVIVPRNRMALRWVDGSNFVFAKRVKWPGIRPDPFLYQALEAREGQVVEIFNHYADLAMDEIADAIVK